VLRTSFRVLLRLIIVTHREAVLNVNTAAHLVTFGLWAPREVWLAEPVGEEGKGTTTDVFSREVPSATSGWSRT